MSRYGKGGECRERRFVVYPAKLNPNGMFSTPESQEALLKYCESFTGSEKLVALTVFGMTWNLAAKLTNGVKAPK